MSAHAKPHQRAPGVSEGPDGEAADGRGEKKRGRACVERREERREDWDGMGHLHDFLMCEGL